MLEAIQEDNTAQAFTVMLYQSEIERIKYLLRSYLRTRLQKIEKHVMYYTSTDDYISRMSVSERHYAQRYRALHEGHLRKSCLDKLPPAVQALDEMHGDIPMVTEPNLHSAVICRVMRDVGDFAITESETVEMKKDNIFLVGYQAIQPLLAEGHVELL
ncbi:GINS complex subunit [Dimargaris xerosporica]|nr:GINS complex subunit [Dimargaris xerosporica]